VRKIENQILDEERALYGSRNILVKNCVFDGPADGESALKESADVQVQNSVFRLRYPFWHDKHLNITGSELSDSCRAALWYDHDVEITDTKLHGIKALRESEDVLLEHCDIVSSEFGWFNRNIRMKNCSATGEYFMLKSQNLTVEQLKLDGKYSFQYVENAVIENSSLKTKDAFWHAKNVTVRNSLVQGEYLGWYSDGLVLDHCRIVGTQPLCYCKNLKLIECEMIDTDLCFEKSQVDAAITTPMISIKNPLSGTISVPELGQLILDDIDSKATVLIGNSNE
jgi:hypothetical protein